MPSYTEFINYLFWKSGKSAIPLSGTFELTARCNLDCRMCYIHKRANDELARKRELSAEEWIDIARIAQKKGMLLLLLTGGEPLLRPDFREIYTACRKLGLLVSVNTNATLINEDWVRFFKASMPARLNITIYGANAETYRDLCGDSTACDRVYTAVRMLKDAGIPVKINYSLTRQNYADLEPVMQFTRDNGLPIQVATYMFPPVRACELGCCTSERMSPEEAAQGKWIYDRFRFTDEQLKVRSARILEGRHVDDPDNECQEFPTERIRCRAGSTTFWMTYDGCMRPCGMMEIPSVNAREAGFEQAWLKIREEREKIMIPAKCTACRWKEVCEFCPATCYGENRDFEQSPEYICRTTESYMSIARDWLNTQK